MMKWKMNKSRRKMKEIIKMMVARMEVMRGVRDLEERN